MNVVAVKVNTYQQEEPTTVTVPIATPDLAEVRLFADRLHRLGKEYSGRVWGWPVQYDPELYEDDAEFQVPDKQGGYRIERRPFWSPASFTLGESGVWFFSLLWEHGRDKPPVEFLDIRNRVAQATTLEVD